MKNFMTREDLRILCTALGFTAVIMKDVPGDNQAVRAVSIARLIESFCLLTEPEAFGAPSDDEVSTERKCL